MDPVDRPLAFTWNNYTIQCKYDHLGRRVEKTLTQDGTLLSRQTYLYKGYLQIAELETTDANTPPALKRTVHWDPTEPVATRPLMLTQRRDNAMEVAYYHHDHNKNITQLDSQVTIREKEDQI